MIKELASTLLGALLGLLAVVLLAAGLLIVIVVIGTGPAAGQTIQTIIHPQATTPYPPGCGPREGFISWLESRFQETRVALGLVDPGAEAILELYISPGGNTWTLLLTRSTGRPMVCVVSEGTAWQSVTPKDIESRSPSRVGDLL